MPVVIAGLRDQQELQATIMAGLLVMVEELQATVMAVLLVMVEEIQATVMARLLHTEHHKQNPTKQKSCV